MQNKIYLGNLNYTAQEDDIRNYFMDYGNISEVTIPVDRMTKKARGFAFVTFEDSSAAQAALEKDGQEFMGRVMKINLAKERDSSRSGGGARSGGGRSWND